MEREEWLKTLVPGKTILIRSYGYNQDEYRFGIVQRISAKRGDITIITKDGHLRKFNSRGTETGDKYSIGRAEIVEFTEELLETKRRLDSERLAKHICYEFFDRINHVPMSDLVTVSAAIKNTIHYAELQKAKEKK